MPDFVTESGLTSKLLSKILAVMRALSEDERAAVLALSHEELVAMFKEIARIAGERHRDYHNISPNHKRVRRAPTAI